MITSAQNTQVKNVIKLNQKAKARREQGLFIAEGRKMFLEAPDDWIEKVYVAESLLDDEDIMQKAGRFSWDAVENSVFRKFAPFPKRNRYKFRTDMTYLKWDVRSELPDLSYFRIFPRLPWKKER